MIAPVMSVDQLGPSFDYATMRDPTGYRLNVNREDPTSTHSLEVINWELFMVRHSPGKYMKTRISQWEMKYLTISQFCPWLALVGSKREGKR